MLPEHQHPTTWNLLPSPSRPCFAALCLLGVALLSAVRSSAQNPTPKAPAQVNVEMPPMRYVPGMQEPLVGTGPVTRQENGDLDAALAAFHDAPAKAGRAADFDDYAKPLLTFIDTHPASNWNASLYLDIGLGYYQSGYYSRTFTYLDKAWQLGRNATSPQARLMVDRAVGELARMHARVGHDKELEALFSDIGQRPIGGPATELLQGAREGQWTFRDDPGEAYLCGPNALRNVLITLKAKPAEIEVAQKARSGPHGFSLEELAALADKTNLDYKLIHREPGQPIPIPSIIHWNVAHFAAIIGRRGDLNEVADPTFGGGGSLVTAKAIDAESSGYFLVPAMVFYANPSSGWRTVSADSAEAKAVYGMGTIYAVVPGANCNCDLQTPSETFGDDDIPVDEAMVSAKAHLMAVSLHLTDTPIGYKPQKGPSALTQLSYSSREAEQPANFSFSNVSPKWTHSWLGYIQDDPNIPGNAVTRIAPGGGGYDYDIVNYYSANIPIYDSATGAFIPETYDNSQLFRYPATGPATSYVRYFPDGSREVYAVSNGATTYPRLMFLTQVIDPTGNATTLDYDATFRLTTVTDAMGRKTSFLYRLTNAPLLITTITDPFGRSSQLTYDTSGRLSSITDRIGITSSFTYGSASEPNFITQLTTPYGVSTFSDTPNPNDPQPYFARSLTLTDPLGNVDYLYLNQNQSTTGTPISEAALPSGMTNDSGILQWRNTYYWNRHQSALGVKTNASGTVTSENFAYPTIYHWLHFCCSLVYESNQLGSIKKPLEQYRQWFNYPNPYQPPSGYWYWSGSLIKPNAKGRVLDDGTTQLSTSSYNGLGLPLSTTDPNGRITEYTYAPNNIDVLSAQQLTAAPSTYSTIATFGNYNAAHEPQTYTGADGEPWKYAYNSAGQPTTITDPDSKTTTYDYDTLGRHTSIVNANHATALRLTYDSADRVATRTDSEGYTLTYTYDNLDRVTKITYPDGTTDQYDWTFQSGPETGAPSLDLRKHTDRLGRVTTYAYDADRRLTSVTEPVEGATTRTTSYAYYEDGTLMSITDANGNVTRWNIDAQSRPTSKTYAYGTTNATTETYAYELTNSRLHSVTDALGQVKTFTYAHDDRVTNVAYTNVVNPTPNVSLAWDPFFPRLTSMTDGTGTTNYGYIPIGTNGGLKLASSIGPYHNDGIYYGYDRLGRVASRDIKGGRETFKYDAINRLATHGTPLGTFDYSYLGQTDQTTSRSVTNGATTVSTAWSYGTNTNDRRLIDISNSGVSRSYALSYVALDIGSRTINPYDIMGITDTAAPGHPFATQSHAFAYDSIDRLLIATASTPGDSRYVYDPLDNITTVTDSGGTTDATYNNLNQLMNWGSNSYDYDANGNTLSGNGGQTYKWDAENRPIEIDYAGGESKTMFAYDGLGHRIVDTEVNSKGDATVARYLWCGDRICQTRSASDDVLRRDLDEGEFNVASGEKLVYMDDQLGSVRDVLDAMTGVRVQSYDYSPYGAIARSKGNISTDYQYAGLMNHPASGLLMSATRFYDPVSGRWLSRDWIKEAASPNLYAYVKANTINYIDRLGLQEYNGITGPPPGEAPVPERLFLWLQSQFLIATPSPRLNEQSDPYHYQAFWKLKDSVEGGDFFVLPCTGNLPLRYLLQKLGTLENQKGEIFNGVYEYIIEPGQGLDAPILTHARFIPGGTITGYPNQKPE